MDITRRVVKSFGLRHQDNLLKDKKRFSKIVDNMNKGGIPVVLQKRIVPGERYVHWSIVKEEYQV